MPTVTRPDGVEIAWRERGEGTPVVLANLGYAPESFWAGLIEDLAGDHRVVTCDPRGAGDSSRAGPYEIATDAADLVAVVEDADAAGAVLVGNGDGANRAVRAAAQAEDLFDAVVLPGAIMPPVASGAGEGLSSSASVLRGLTLLLEKDYKAGVHSFVGSGNPGLDDPDVHERVEQIVRHGSHEATLGRVRSWIADDVMEVAAALGDRLWLLHHRANPWGFARSAEYEQLLPDAHHEHMADGPMERPDLTAAAVRRLTRTGAR